MARSMGTQTRTTADDLIADLREARQVELAVFTDLADDQMLGPQERFLEPPDLGSRARGVVPGILDPPASVWSATDSAEGRFDV